MTTERDELIRIIWDEAVADRVKSGESPHHVPIVRPKVEAMADRILAAGYSKPRRVATADELDPLPFETVIRDSSGRVLDRWVESDDDDPCCDECRAWAAGTDVDEQTRQEALQDAINAAFEQLKKASISYSLPQGLFVIRKGEE